MFDCSTADALVDERFDDPRITSRFLRCVPGGPGRGAVLLVGVVHDHPASTYRVARILETVEADVLALELPPLAMPLFRLYGRDVDTPPRLGGEMSMALQAADETPAVGIDAPNRRYLRLLGRELLAGRVDLNLAVPLLRDLVAGFGQAAACRLGAVVGSYLGLRFRLYTHIEYDCSLLDPPALQAAHETRHLSRQQGFLRAIEIPPAMALIDANREESMATRLDGLRAAGDVIAIVGMEHLDPLADRLRELAPG